MIPSEVTATASPEFGKAKSNTCNISRVTRPPSPLTRAVLATRHGKEAIFAPRLAAIGVGVEVADVDTDRFGTFSGEIERVGSPREVVERKARAAVASSDSSVTIGLASEGSFGPHPVIPFLLSDTELVAWVDVDQDHVVVERASAFSKVPAAVRLGSPRDPAQLPIADLFPDQAAIVSVESEQESEEERSRTIIAKGIDSVDLLTEALADAFDLGFGTVVVEPDLRAHLCPERREVIAAAVDRLVQRLERRCPRCAAPGFGLLRQLPGLRCALCDLPTTEASARVEGCTRCRHEVVIPISGDADPTHCDRCNP